MHHHRSGVRRGGGLDPAQEGQQACGVVGHAVLGPRGEMELAHLVVGRVAALQQQGGQAPWREGGGKGGGMEGRVERWREDGGMEGRVEGWREDGGRGGMMEGRWRDEGRMD